MSEPKRYAIRGFSAALVEEDNGVFIRYEDYARLKAEVERLRKAAVTGGYNLSEYIRMANSETLEFDNGDIFAEMTLPERIKYIVESHARLKAEVERLRASSFVTAVPVEEYEKVKEDAALWKLRSDNWQKYVQLLQEEINRLKNAAKDGKPTE